MKTMKIYGPPGTGKTTTLISTLKKLLERGYHPSQIAYLSHTKAAAEEAKRRISQEFTGYDLKQDFRWFRTIHSACCGLLKVGFNEILGTSDLKTFSSETGWIVKGNIDMETAVDLTEGERTHDIILNARSLASHRMVELNDVIVELPDDPALASAERFLTDYDAFKERLGKIDFIDMLEMCTDKSLPVKVVLVDECQDLSDRQWALIHSFASDADYLYLAGDDDQAIYEFMGSSNGGFLDHPFDKETVLDYSYRCAKPIGEAAEKIIARVKNRHEKQITWRDEQGEVQKTGMGVEELPWHDWANGDKEVMVLFRHQKQVWKLYYMLQDMDIPVTVKHSGVTISDLAMTVKTYLDMRHNAASYKAVDIAKMLRKCGDTKAANAVLKLDPKTPDKLFNLCDCPSHIWTVNDWPKAFAKWDSERKKLNVLRRLVNIHGIDVIGTTPTIDLGTYHGSKGQQADIVVLNTDCYKRTWDDQQLNPDVETRLCYVGLTRAKEKALILLPRSDMYMRALVEN